MAEIEMTIDSIKVSLMNYRRTLILKEKEAEKYLAMWIGPAEAEAIAIKLQGVQSLRPLTHDFGIMARMCNRVAVMYAGKIVESANSEELYSKPLHPYTQALLSAALPSHPDAQRKEIVLPEEVPSPLNPPAGCRFHPRCQYVKPLCSETEPPLADVTHGHQVACHLQW